MSIHSLIANLNVHELKLSCVVGLLSWLCFCLSASDKNVAVSKGGDRQSVRKELNEPPVRASCFSSVV